MTSEPPAAPDAAGSDAPPSDPAPPPRVAPDEGERRMHPAWILAKAIAELKNFLPAFIALGVGLRAWAVPAALAIVLLELGLLTLRWRTTRYAVAGGSLRLRSGVFNRSERVVPASRISALDTTRGVVQRAFGLVSLEVQTAGGGKEAELRLDALSTAEAERLRAALGHARAVSSAAPSGWAVPDGGVATPAAAPLPDQGAAGVPGPADAAPGPAWPTGSAEADDAPVVYAITGRELVVAALTGPQLTLVAIVVGSLVSQFNELLPRGLKDRAEDVVTGADAVTVVVLVVLALLLAAALAVVGTVLAFAEFTVRRDDRRLRVRRGLLTERTGTIPLDRVHGVRIVEGLLRRPLGYATVQVEVAGYRGGSDTMRTLVPLVRRSELPALLERVLPELTWPDAELEGPPSRARRRYWIVPMLWSLVPAAAAVIWLPDAWKVVGVLPVLVATAIGDGRWRGAGWHLGTDAIAVRSQLLARTTLLALPRRAQHVAVRTNPFQRRADLAAFDIVLATKRHGIVRHLDAATADGLQRAVASAATKPPPADVLRDLPLTFAAAPPE